MTPHYSRLACLLAPAHRLWRWRLGRGAAGGPDYSLTVTLPEAGTLCVNLNQNASCDAGSPVSAALPVLTG